MARPAKITLKLEGAKNLERALKRVAPELLEAFKDPVQATTRDVLAVSKAAAPQDDGELASSGVLMPAPEIGPRGTQVFSAAGFTAEHAPFVEVGVHNGKEQKNTGANGYRFMATAVKPLRAVFKRDIKAAALAVLRRYFQL